MYHALVDPCDHCVNETQNWETKAPPSELILFWRPGLDTKGSQLENSHRLVVIQFGLVGFRFPQATLASKRNEIDRPSSFSRKTSWNFIVGVSCYGHMLFSTYANLTVARKRVPEHVIMLKEIFDKQDSIFWKRISMFFFVTKLAEQTWASW